MNKKKNYKHQNKKKSKVYFSYGFRLFIFLLLFLALFLVGVSFIFKALVLKEQKVIQYSEKSNLDYKVYLNENDFYDQEYLGKDMFYVASLIDKIHIDFNYDFSIEEMVDLNFQYDIIGKVVISDENDTRIYYEKEYQLLDKNNVSLVDDYSRNIRETIVIDYDQYNSIANQFKNSYGLDTTSKLVIYFKVDKSLLGDSGHNLFVDDRINMMSIVIPLSEKSVDISMNYKDINNQSRIVDNTSLFVHNIMYFVFGIFVIVISFVFLFHFFKMLSYVHKKKNAYDVYIDKIIEEYDRYIAETTSSPFLTQKNIVKIQKFTELLDIRDNLKQPIMYYNVSDHEKCYFYIDYNDKVYLTTIKKVDLEGSYEK